MTIYLDAIWLLNFLVDLILLMITRLFIKVQTSTRRLIIGALLASTLVPITIFYPTSFLSSIYGKVFYSMLIILCAFPVKSLASFLHILFSFYFISFVIGGGLISIYFLMNSPISISANGIITFDKGYGDPISWLFVIVSFPIVVFFTKRRLDMYTIEKIKFDHLYQVYITINKAEKKTQGYMDSGNQLVDPLTKHPVIICDEPLLKHWFTKEDWSFLKELYETLNYQNIPSQWIGKVHLIPYRGVDGNNKMLVAIRPDKVKIVIENERIITKNIYIGIQFSTLSNDQSYHCLLHPELLQLEKSTA